MEDLIKDIIDLWFAHGFCPSCNNKDLDELCPTCMFINGIPYRDIVENNWTKKQALEVAQQRKIN